MVYWLYGEPEEFITVLELPPVTDAQSAVKVGRITPYQECEEDQMNYTTDELYAGMRQLLSLCIQQQEMIALQQEQIDHLTRIVMKSLPTISEDDRAAYLSRTSARSSHAEHEQAFVATLKAGFQKLPETSARSPFDF